jgi:hypothetical protein
MRAALFLCVLALLWLAPARGLTCASKREAADLLYRAALDSTMARFYYELGGPGAGADAGDLEHETKRIAGAAERAGLLMSSATIAPMGRPADMLWARDARLTRDFGVLQYGPGGTDCAPLLDDAEARRAALLPTVYQLVELRASFSGAAACSDYNQRLQWNPLTGKAECTCPEGKTCGVHGAHHQRLVTLAIAFFIAIALVVTVAMLFAAVRAVQRQDAAMLARPARA